MKFNDDEWTEILTRLEQATNARTLRWARSDEWSFADEYVAPVPGSVTYAIRSRDGDEQFPFIVRALDDRGEEVAEFQTAPSDWTASGTSSSAIATRLYETIARIVTGAPEKAQSLIESLEKLVPQEGEPF
jgi:hypothetical protein